MKVTKKKLHNDLKRSYHLYAFLPKVLRFAWIVRLLNVLSARFRAKCELEGVRWVERYIPSVDGSHLIRVLVFRPEKGDRELPAMVYCHGGGYIMGRPENSIRIIRKFIKARPCVIIAPDYRKALRFPFPAGFNDCYESLLWARDNAAELNIRNDKFILAGHSAGGGLAAALSLKARDTKDIDVAFQMPIYPMIDDRQPQDITRNIISPVWDTRLNRVAWQAYLKNCSEVTAYAAPARSKDNRGLPPTITFVGTLEPFYWETAEYVKSLKAADVEVVYQEYEGCYHGFDILGGSARVSREARDFTCHNFERFYDKYLLSM